MFKTVAMCFYSKDRTIFEKPKNEDDVAHAQAMCAVCPSKDKCLMVAQKLHMDSGVWGGVLFGEVPDAVPAGR